MNSFMSWVGGKKALREEVVRRFPLFYERYVEVFGGGGWVLFHKPPGNDFEVYNDYNGLLSNLYRCVRDKPDLLINSLKYVLNSREDFDRARLALRRKRTTDIQRAAWFYQVIRQSYAAALTSFASQPHDLWSDFPLIEQAHRRLADVVVENQDFGTLIRHYDRPVTFFYCDPPYHATEGYYQNIGEDGFKERDHIRLRDALLSMEGKFLLSYNDDAFIRELYDAPGIQIEPVTRLNNIRQRYDPNSQFAELLIANYDMAERSHATTQINLFDYQKGEFDYQEDISYTLTATDHHAVFSRQRVDKFVPDNVTSTESARQHKDATDLVLQTWKAECPLLIRRLTPLECERLQGFPDGWTNIPSASDSARYKALGNSVAIPCVEFILRGIVMTAKTA